MHSVLALEDRNSMLSGDERRGGGGGWIWHNFVHTFLHSWKKNHRDIILTQKVRHAKFQPIRRLLENRYEIVIWGRLARSYSISKLSPTYHPWILVVLSHNTSCICHHTGFRLWSGHMNFPSPVFRPSLEKKNSVVWVSRQTIAKHTASRTSTTDDILMR